MDFLSKDALLKYFQQAITKNRKLKLMNLETKSISQNQAKAALKMNSRKRSIIRIT